MFRFWDVAAMSWLFQVMLNYLFIILPVYAAHLDLGKCTVGQLFAVNIGARFLPNLLVTKIGAKSEVPMMFLTLAGFIASWMFPTDLWALYAVASGCGCGFTRACVSLHAQRACGGDLDALTMASKRCSAARSIGDISGFILPALAYKVGGWSAFTAFGAVLCCLYLLLALLQLNGYNGPVDAEEENVDATDRRQLTSGVKPEQKPPIAWIDWAVSAAFISTELQMNLFITCVPQALLKHFSVPPPYVGTMVAAGAIVTLVYLTALPYLPQAFNQHRPMNLIYTYSGMFVGWLFMFGAASQPYAATFLMAAYFYQAMVGASQMVMLECLTGVCDSVNSAKILGIAEMVGCAFGMVGGYAGEALLLYGLSAPFCVGLFWSLFSVLFLVVSFVFRQTQRDRVAYTALEVDPEKQKDSEKLLLISMITGMNKMALERQNSFLSSEIEHRQSEMKLLVEFDRASTATPSDEAGTRANSPTNSLSSNPMARPLAMVDSEFDMA